MKNQVKEVTLGSILQKRPQNGFSPVCPTEPTGKWVLGLAALDENGLNLAGAKPAPIDEPLVDKFLLEEGDFLISRSNTLDKVGRVGVFRGGLANCSYPDLMMRFRPNTSLVSPDFLEACLRSDQTARYIQRHATGTSGSMKKINQAIVESIPVVLLPMAEQMKVAKIHSSWDLAIRNSNALVQKKLEYFSWLREHLIESECNHSGFVRLDQVASIPSKVPLTTIEDDFALTVKLHCKGIERNEKNRPKQTENGRPFYRRAAGEFLVGRQNIHNGGFGVIPLELDGGIASNAITSVVTNSEKLSAEYLFYFFSRPKFYLQLEALMGGTGQKEMSESELMKLKVALPSIERQQKIVEILNAAGAEIDILQDLFKKYQLQKAAIMKKLLSGEWHAPVPEDEVTA
jgi:type I restriction enzyme S subunit